MIEQAVDRATVLQKLIGAVTVGVQDIARRPDDTAVAQILLYVLLCPRLELDDAFFGICLIAVLDEKGFSAARGECTIAQLIADSASIATLLVDQIACTVATVTIGKRLEMMMLLIEFLD